MELQSPSKDDEAEALVVDPNQNNSQFLSPATYLRVKDNYTLDFPTGNEPNYHQSFVALETILRDDTKNLLVWRIRKGWEVGAVVAVGCCCRCPCSARDPEIRR